MTIKRITYTVNASCDFVNIKNILSGFGGVNANSLPEMQPWTVFHLSSWQKWSSMCYAILYSHEMISIYKFSENSCLPISIQFVILGILCIKTGHQSSGKQEDKTTSYFWIPGFSGLKYHTMSNNLHKQAIDLQMLKFLCNTINEYI